MALKQFSVKEENKRIYNKTLNAFRGVDITNSPIFVEDYRACDMSNLVLKDGVLQKRMGWKEIKQLANKIHNIEKIVYTDDNGTKQVKYLVQNGKALCYSTVIDGTYTEVGKMFANEDVENKVSMFAKNNNVYITTGVNFYRYNAIDNTLNRLNYNDDIITSEMLSTNEDISYINTLNAIPDVYIPTTTIAITAEDNVVFETKGELLDSVNLLTRWRKNTILMSTIESATPTDNTGLYYNLETGEYFSSMTTYEDVPPNSNWTIADINTWFLVGDDVYKVKVVSSGSGTPQMGAQKEYSILKDCKANSDYSLIVDANNNVLKGQIETSYLLDGRVKKNDDNIHLIIVETEQGNILVQGTDYIISDYTMDIDNVKTRLTFNNLLVPQIEGKPNINVYFADDSTIDIDIVGKCKFGHIYGNKDNRDTLFLAGNDKVPNIDIHSNADNWDYFPADNYNIFGFSSSNIKGYLTLADGKQAILKEESVYYRDCELMQAIDSAGNPKYDANGNILYAETYTVSQGNIGEGCVSYDSCMSLAGDSLFISKNGVFAIETKASVNAIERYAKPRSRLINRALEQHNLENVICTVHDNKYIISIDDKAYVADARYKYQLKDDLNDTFQYEWFIWNNIKASCLKVIDGILYMGTSEGHIAKFSYEHQFDTTYKELGDGELCWDDANKVFYTNNQTEIENVDKYDAIEITSDNYTIFSKLFEEEENRCEYTIENEIKISRDYFDERDKTYKTLISLKALKLYIANKSEEYYLYIDDMFREEDEENYYLKLLDSDDNEATLTSSDIIVFELPKTNKLIDIKCFTNEGQVYNLNDVAFDEKGHCYEVVNGLMSGEVLTTEIEGETVYITKEMFNSFNVAMMMDKELTLGAIPYNSEDLNNITAKITHNDIIPCHYITKAFDLGSTQYLKDINRLIMTPDNLFGIEVDFGYQTINKDEMYSLNTGEKIDFDSINFGRISFGDKEFARTWVKKIHAKNVNFIRFLFKNSSNSKFKISNLQVIYTLGKQNKGVR